MPDYINIANVLLPTTEARALALEAPGNQYSFRQIGVK